MQVLVVLQKFDGRFLKAQQIIFIRFNEKLRHILAGHFDVSTEKAADWNV